MSPSDLPGRLDVKYLLDDTVICPPPLQRYAPTFPLHNALRYLPLEDAGLGPGLAKLGFNHEDLMETLGISFDLDYTGRRVISHIPSCGRVVCCGAIRNAADCNQEQRAEASHVMWRG